ncbi:Glucose-6-phosphatase 3 [Armadillidium nasatum]|uniref:glucose-6-phosphatase n=1 Tax=Armadillidium nasatum TaxID=96803 RepID=A0A5N5SRY2_9CRUS|nr:Glucose-6-phosphatase 3 [Armadillidium nasatum]
MNLENTNLSITEEWNLKSAETILFLQERFHSYEWWILQCSSFGTKEAITILFPLVAGFSNVLGVRMLWAVILSEWSNLILKWLFKGDRPYWWMQQHNIASNIARNLNQFPSTCESGPGTPSGHLMLHVAASFVIIKGISKFSIWGTKKTLLTKFLFSLIVYLIFDVWIVSVFVSRLYIQAHFIHQCVFGVIIGLLIGSVVWNSSSLTKLKPFGSTLFANFLIGTSLLTYGLLLSYGLDPLWAVPLALQYCERPEYDLPSHLRIEKLHLATLEAYFALP